MAEALRNANDARSSAIDRNLTQVAGLQTYAQNLAENNRGLGQAAHDYVLDIAVGIDPVTGFGRSSFDFFMGVISSLALLLPLLTVVSLF